MPCALAIHALSQGRLDRIPMEWLLSARRSFTSKNIDVSDPDVGRPEFRNVLARFQLDYADDMRLTAGWLSLENAADGQTIGIRESAAAGYADTTYWLRWQREWAPQSSVNITIARMRSTGVRDGGTYRIDESSASLHNERRIDATRFNAEVSMPLGSDLRSTLGMERDKSDTHAGFTMASEYGAPLGEFLGHPPASRREFRLSQRGSAQAVYGSLQWNPLDRLTTDLGWRWDSMLMPRLSAEYRLSEATTLRAALGAHAQAQRLHELAIADGETGLQPVERSRQAVLSVDRRWNDAFTLRVEGYAKSIRDPHAYYENLFDPVVLLPEADIDRVRVAPDSAFLYGIETSLRWTSPGPWSGWFQYARSDAKDRIDGRDVPRSWNVRHALNTGVSWAHSRWQLTASASWRDGWRTTDLTQSATDLNSFVLGQRNGAQLPDVFTLDLRANWLHPLRWGALHVSGEVLNATDAESVCCINYELRGEADPLPPREPAHSRVLERHPQNRSPRAAFLSVTWEIP